MLVDQFGREIKSNKPILEEVAVQTVRDRYSSYPSQGLTPERLTRIFKEADQGDVTRQAELFEEMEEKDLHLGGVLQTRRLAVSGLEWEILPASGSAEDKQIAEAAHEMIEYVENWEDALLDALDAIGKGFAVQEIIWEIAENKVWAKTLEWVHQKRFTFNGFASEDRSHTSSRNGTAIILKVPRLLTEEEPVWGEELLPNKFVLHQPRSRSGIVPRGGLLRPCSWAYLFKNFGVKDWLIFLELFSVPMRVGKYKPGATSKEIDVLKQAVMNLGVDAAAVISESTLIEILETKSKGGGSSGGSFGEFAEFWDKAMSKAVLGHTGSVEGTPGKLGGEDQAKQVRQDLLEADAKALMKTIKFGLLKPWVGFNFGPEKGVPIFKLHFEGEEDLEKTAKVYGILVKDVNFQGIPEDHLYERFGIPKPTAGQKTVSAAQAQSTQAGPGLPGQARSGATPAALRADRNGTATGGTATQQRNREFAGLSGNEGISDLIAAQHDIDGLADAALSRGRPDLNELYRIVDEAGSYEDLQERLAEVYRGIDMDGFMRLMEQALFMAELKGRSLQ